MAKDLEELDRALIAVDRILAPLVHAQRGKLDLRTLADRVRTVLEARDKEIRSLKAREAVLVDQFAVSPQTTLEEDERIASHRPTKLQITAAIAELEFSKFVYLKCGEPAAFSRNELRRLVCCDCGLVHLVNVVKVTDEYVILTFTRNEMYTAKVRRENHPHLVDPSDGAKKLLDMLDRLGVS